MTRTFLTAVFLYHAIASAAGAATLGGTVVDPDGAAVPGASVIVSARGAVVVQTITDASGAFTVDPLPADAYRVSVAHDGFRAAPVDVTLGPDDRRTVTIRLQVSAIAEAVVVSAAQVDLPLSRTPASTTVVTRTDLEQLQHTTVAEALSRVPGVSLARNGGEGSVSSVFSRGGESDFTAVAIDGVPVNAFGGSFDFGHLTTGDVERLEVVRGPQSALWSGGAIGGVIQIITTPQARPGLTASAEAGSRRTRRLSAGVTIPSGDWRLAFSGSRDVSRGYDGRLAANGERVSNDDWTSERAGASVRRDGVTRAQLTARLERSERGFPGPFGSDPGGTFPGLDRISRGTNDSVLLGGSLSRVFDRFRPSVQATWYRFESDFASPFGASESGSRRGTARAQVDIRLARPVDATIGAEWLSERATSTFIAGASGAMIPVRRRLASFFAEARADTGRLFVTAGTRVEHIRREGIAGDPSPFSPRPAIPADARVAVTPRVSASWFARPANARGEWTRLRASAGLGIRPPDAFELVFTDNPALAPERTRSVEAGLEHALWRARVVVEATAFVNRYDDLIVTVGRSLSDASRYQSDNISNARARGVEALVSARPGRGLSAAVAYTFLDSEILAVDRLGVAPPPFAPGDSLIRRPRHQAWAEFRLSGAAISAFAAAGARGRTLDIDPSYGAFGGLFPNTGYISADLGASWRVAQQVEVFGRVTNLFDRRYEEVLGFPAARRGAYIGMRVRTR